MLKNSDDCNIKNHTTTSSDGQLVEDDRSDLGISVNAVWGTSLPVEINQQIDTESYAKVANERYFLICDSCLWCASYFGNEMTDTKCPLCHKGKIDCMPIAEDKNYRFDYRTLEVLQ